MASPTAPFTIVAIANSFFWRIVKVRWNYFIGWNYFFTGWNYFSIPGINFLIPGIIFLIPGIIFYIKISRVIVNYFNTPIFTYFLYLPTSIRDLAVVKNISTDRCTSKSSLSFLMNT